MNKIKSDIKYQKPNGQIRKYDVYKNEKTGKEISVDKDEFIWAEKYRPRILDDLIIPSAIKNKVEQIIKTKKIPNLLFFSVMGGTGKDSIISVIKAQVPMTMLTINASLERGMDTIKNKVVKFVSTNSIDGTRKVIYLTEAGGLTPVAMDSLKSVIEENSKRMSFFMTTNTISNISHPLKSRFEFFDMNVIPHEEKGILAKEMLERLCFILELENIEYDYKDVGRLVVKYFPSYREMIIALQQNVVDNKFVYGASTIDDEIKSTLIAINEKNYEKCVRLSKNISIEGFMQYIQNHYDDNLLESTQFFPAFISAFNTLQIAINNRVPFPDISFLVFCNELMKANIKFNIK